MKHWLFQFLPGTVGIRNRACFRHLTRTVADEDFERTLRNLGADSVCIDCGANVGSVTLRLAQRAGRVYAFEPDPWSVERLREATRMLANVVVLNEAVGDEDGTVTLHRVPDFGSSPEVSSLGTSIFRRPDSRMTASFEVPVINLVRFIRDLDATIAILKLDVEGAEVAILERLLEDEILHRIETIFVETHELQFPELLLRTEALRKKVTRVKTPRINMDWH